MKSKIQSISIYLTIILSCAAYIQPISVYAEAAEPPLCPYFLTLRPWYCGLTAYATNPDGAEIIKNGQKVVEIKQVVSAETDKITGKKYVIDSQTKNKRELKPNEVDISLFVWAVITNILYDLLSLTGYLAFGFIVYAGYLFLLSRGDPNNIEKAKTTLRNAVIGLVIVLLASSIVAMIGSVITT